MSETEKFKFVFVTGLVFALLAFSALFIVMAADQLPLGGFEPSMGQVAARYFMSYAQARYHR